MQAGTGTHSPHQLWWEGTLPAQKESRALTEIGIALQLYTVRHDMARDFAGTLRHVADTGYEAVELYDYGGLSSEQMRELLWETRLRPAATHVDYEALERDLDAEIEYCRAIGCSYLVLPAIPPEHRDNLLALATRLNHIGERCGESSLTFAYHNHDWEFGPSDDLSFLDLLFDATDPRLVGIELDVYWAAHAGVDPVAVVRRLAGRLPLIHLKDMASDGGFTELGNGTLDLPAICAAARDAGAHWLIVENDQPRIPALESARRSLEYLRGIPLD